MNSSFKTELLLAVALSTVSLTADVGADTITLLDDYKFVCRLHIEEASQTFEHEDPAKWLEFELGYWTLAIPRSIVKSATVDDLYQPPERDEDERRMWETFIEIRQRERDLSGGAGQQTAVLAATLDYLRNFAQALPPGKQEWVELVEGDLLSEGSQLEVKRNSRAEASIGERLRMGIRAGTQLAFNSMKQSVEDERTLWEVDLGFSVGGIWIEVAGLEPNELVEMDVAGCRFEVAADSLLSVTSALGTRYALGYWRGPGALSVSAPEYSDAGGFSVRQGYMVVFGPGEGSVPEHRLPAGGEEEWRRWREFEPVTFDLEFRLIPPPLEQMPSKEVRYSLRESRVTETVEIRGEVKTSLLQDLAAHLRAMESFKNDVGRYPTPEEGLGSLREDAGIEGWKGPYLGDEVQPLDPWEQPYRYRVLGSGGAAIPVIYSTGQNRTDEYGLGDDIHGDIASLAR